MSDSKRVLETGGPSPTLQAPLGGLEDTRDADAGGGVSRAKTERIESVDPGAREMFMAGKLDRVPESEDVTRSCGSCSLCCEVLGVPSLGKEAGDRCDLLGRFGCSEYDGRPDECRKFFCHWIQGFGDFSVRPDRVGYVLSSPPGIAGVQTLRLHFTTRDGLEQWSRLRYTRRMVKSIVEGGGVVYLISGERRRIVTTNEKVLDALLSAPAFTDVELDPGSPPEPEEMDE